MERPLFGIEGAKTRNYVFASDGVWKIPKRMLGRMVFPQNAGTKQKMLDVFFCETIRSSNVARFEMNQQSRRHVGINKQAFGRR